MKSVLTMMFFVAFVILLAGCRKVYIYPALPDEAPVVIEAIMTNLMPLMVTVSRVSPFEKPDEHLPLLLPALVKIKDDAGNEALLAEIEPGRYACDWTAVPGRIYHLTVQTEEPVAEAAVVCPTEPAAVEQLAYEWTSDTTVLFSCKMQLPANRPVYLRLQLFVEGKVQEEYLLEKTAEHNAFTELSFEPFPAAPGTNVAVELATLSKQAYEFYGALGKNIRDNNYNPVNSKNPPTNFSGGGIGFFSAALTDTVSLVIQ